MIFAPCAKRQEIKQTARDGTQSTLTRCAHPDCEQLGHEVTPEICEACPLRVAPRKKANLAAIKAANRFPDCDDAILRRRCQPCGRPVYPPAHDRICLSPDSGYRNQRVYAKICHACPVRLVLGQQIGEEGIPGGSLDQAPVQKIGE